VGDQDRPPKQFRVGDALQRLLEVEHWPISGTTCFDMAFARNGHSRVPAPPRIKTEIGRAEGTAASICRLATLAGIAEVSASLLVQTAPRGTLGRAPEGRS
jgi:hypothetical protein